MHGIPECATVFCKLNVTNEPAIISLHLGHHHSAWHFLFFLTSLTFPRFNLQGYMSQFFFLYI